MGYYTYYTGMLVATKTGTKEKEIAQAIAKLPYFSPDYSPRDECDEIELIDDAIGMDSMKWYNCFTDMCEVSKQFPDCIIMIHGEGEDREDMWNAYFKNGKYAVYRAEITYPDFNPKDLED